jgi:hypothetical protein
MMSRSSEPIACVNASKAWGHAPASSLLNSAVMTEATVWRIMWSLSASPARIVLLT